MKLVIFQRFVRLLLLAKKNIRGDIFKLEEIINNIYRVLDNYYRNNVINSHKYTINVIKLEEINSLLLSASIFKSKDKQIIYSRKIMTSVQLQLKTLAESTGSLYFSDIIYLITGYYVKGSYIDMINKIYTPTNYKIYKLNIKYNFKNKKDCIEIYDQKNFKKYSDHVFLNLYKDKSIHDTISGSRYYYFMKKLNIVLVCDGYLCEDPFHNVKKKYFKEKYKDLYIVSKKKKNKTFIKNYLEQLSLKEFMVFDIKTIIINCQEILNLFIKIKTETISSMVKIFLSSQPIKQRKILISLYLDHPNKHYSYLSFLLFDLINNDSFILKANPVSDEIYNSFHWSIKQNFRANLNKHKTNLISKKFNENDIPYDKRINLMKTDDIIKTKAFNKLKEIENNRNDSSKSQQYLDGLLQIPFGIFKKEQIFRGLDEMIEDIHLLRDKTDFFQHYELQTRNDVISILDQFNDFKNKEMESVNNKFKYLSITDFKITDIQEIIKQINSFVGNKISLKKEKKSILFLKLIKQIVLITNIDYKIKIANLFGIKTEIPYLEEIDTLNTKWDNYNKNITNYITTSTDILDKAIYKQDAAKNEITRIIGQWINGKMTGYCLGFEGPPGVGKTTLAQKGISKCLTDIHGTRPFSFIQIGGTSNGSSLEGHGYTYQGSKWGKLVDILMDSKCMNPIIYIDELDKISNTENGRELVGILTHITDRSQNKEYEDKYFSGIKIDLSKILFIFSYNDPSLIDKVLLDRIHRINFTPLTLANKLYIIKHYSLPDILEDIGIAPQDIIVPENVITYIVNNYTNESGVRKLKEKIYEIIREINLRNLKHTLAYPIVLDIPFVQIIFKLYSKIVHKKIYTTPHVGLVNGLYATKYGLGGIIIIEISKTISETPMKLKLTGQQGDVMKESMECSKTLAWNIIPDSIKTKLREEWKTNKWGIHIHCPDTSTPKDGPSAGAAITLCLISLLTNTPVLNTVALTGEIDLNGNITQIGGLDSKIEGGKNAGVELILYPESNNPDIEIIRYKEPHILDNIEIKPVKNIWQVLEVCLSKNSLELNHF